MILSFHPCVNGNKNIIFAGRSLKDSDINAMKQAYAVILPQGCKRELYKAAKAYCNNIFPNYNAMFCYQGKIGQSRLFKKKSILYPETYTFSKTDEFADFHKKNSFRLPLNFPFVFKFNWGGEGENVFKINSTGDLEKIIKKAVLYETTGQYGFLIQKFINSENRVLRVVVIGNSFYSYWRLGKDNQFISNFATGAIIDKKSDKMLMQKACSSAKLFCEKTRINLAGFDFLFSKDTVAETLPYIIEINYFFGRKGLGGSTAYYQLLNAETNRWIEGLEINKNIHI